MGRATACASAEKGGACVGRMTCDRAMEGEEEAEEEEEKGRIVLL
jgi:hypothetical protein